MALIHSFEKSGNWLFKHRGELPVVLFLLAVPVVYFTDTDWLSEQSMRLIAIVAVALSLFGFFLRALSIGTTPKGTSGRNTKSGQVAESLNTLGIYSVLRHPLYVGNYFMWIGIVLYTFNFSFVLITSLAFWIYYERIMFAEERFLEKKFGKIYLDWSLKTHAFIPRFSTYRKNTVPFSFKSVLRREYSGMLATVFGFMFIDLFRDYFDYGIFEWKLTSAYVFGAALVITLLLRSLKHYTSLLTEKDRS
ncbi:MAG: isoprenylcysteine carboxylmethyltransferase family protein [Bacteroidetes bacterium]|nr:isoprenylcysteine carboxylmethyltransferase family protein [Bacteroidota bacterium]